RSIDCQCLYWRRCAAAHFAPRQRLARWTEVGAQVVISHLRQLAKVLARIIGDQALSASVEIITGPKVECCSIWAFRASKSARSPRGERLSTGLYWISAKSTLTRTVPLLAVCRGNLRRRTSERAASRLMPNRPARSA